MTIPTVITAENVTAKELVDMVIKDCEEFMTEYENMTKEAIIQGIQRTAIPVYGNREEFGIPISFGSSERPLRKAKRRLSEFGSIDITSLIVSAVIKQLVYLETALSLKFVNDDKESYEKLKEFMVEFKNFAKLKINIFSITPLPSHMREIVSSW